MPDLVSTPIAAKALGISARTIQRYVAAGRIKPDLDLGTGSGRHEYRWDVDRLREQINAMGQAKADE